MTRAHPFIYHGLKKERLRMFLEAAQSLRAEGAEHVAEMKATGFIVTIGRTLS